MHRFHQITEQIISIIFTKENFVNANALLFIGVMKTLHNISEIAQELAPVATTFVGCSVVIFNVVKTYKELKKKD